MNGKEWLHEWLKQHEDEYKITLVDGTPCVDTYYNVVYSFMVVQFPHGDDIKLEICKAEHIKCNKWLIKDSSGTSYIVEFFVSSPQQVPPLK